MSIQPGTHKLGPSNATLRVKTAPTGKAAKMGHNLVIDVTSWSATLVVGENPADTSIELDADGASLEVRDGHGGMKSLTDKDKTTIQESINEDILNPAAIEFRSTEVKTNDDASQLIVGGNLKLIGNEQPVEFTLDVDGDGKLTGTAIVRQTDWKIKIFSQAFGALKVVDEVEVEIDATVPTK
jgi:polyisoprenoid-binding protein YceI